jgi:hypothetical protein
MNESCIGNFNVHEDLCNQCTNKKECIVLLIKNLSEILCTEIFDGVN